MGKRKGTPKYTTAAAHLWRIGTAGTEKAVKIGISGKNTAFCAYNKKDGGEQDLKQSELSRIYHTAGVSVTAASGCMAFRNFPVFIVLETELGVILTTLPVRKTFFNRSQD